MKQTLGQLIAALRKEKGMTQAELAGQMGVTDKAVSKWERDLSCPDVSSLPLLAEVLGVSLDELMQVKKEQAAPERPWAGLLDTILKGVGLAMGVAVAVLAALNALDAHTGLLMLGLGLACLGAAALPRHED